MVALGLVATAEGAAAKKRNPISKLFVTDIQGGAEIIAGDRAKEMEKRKVYTADGTVIETKVPQDEAERAKNYTSMVYSNGTGMHVDADTRLEVQRFVQEPFQPNRTDMDMEPSVSDTQAFLARGTVGLCTSKQAAGSSMVYQTPHAAVNVRGRRVVIESNDRYTKISMLEGESTVRGGSGSALEMGGQVLQAGQQAIIMAGPPGLPPRVTIRPIPPPEMNVLDDKVALACMAKKTVYFDVTEKTVASSTEEKKSEEKKEEEEKKDDEKATAEEKAAAKEADSKLFAADEPGGLSPFAESELVSAFDDDPTPMTAQEIVAIQVVPAELPVQYTVSPAQIGAAKK